MTENIFCSGSTIKKGTSLFMRDKDRINIILLKLKRIWEENPDLRFGQLISNIYSELGYSDPFYVEDTELDNYLDEAIKLSEKRQ